MTIWEWSALCLAALVAGAVNSIAGGGTLLTFPTLMAILGGDGAAAVVANGTNTVALFPGALAGAWGYRRELKANLRWLAWLAGPSLVGGLVGAWLVAAFDPKTFQACIPWLILSATLLFAGQPWLVRQPVDSNVASPPQLLPAIAIQFLIAVYGGYFGAGIGILMLSSLTLLHLGDVHHVNGLKTILAAIINGVAVTVFAAAGQVRWDVAGPMVLAAIVGGWSGAHIARKLPKAVIRWTVISIGLILSVYYFAQG